MERGDFGSREVFFLLLMGAIAIGLSWTAVYLYTDIVSFLGTTTFWLAFVLTNGF